MKKLFKLSIFAIMIICLMSICAISAIQYENNDISKNNDEIYVTHTQDGMSFANPNYENDSLHVFDKIKDEYDIRNKKYSINTIKHVDYGKIAGTLEEKNIYNKNTADNYINSLLTLKASQAKKVVIKSTTVTDEEITMTNEDTVITNEDTGMNVVNTKIAENTINNAIKKNQIEKVTSATSDMTLTKKSTTTLTTTNNSYFKDIKITYPAYSINTIENVNQVKVADSIEEKNIYYKNAVDNYYYLTLNKNSIKVAENTPDGRKILSNEKTTNTFYITSTINNDSNTLIDCFTTSIVRNPKVFLDTAIPASLIIVIN